MRDSIRLVQLHHPYSGRKVALVEEPSLRLLSGYDSVYALCLAAMSARQTITEMVKGSLSESRIDYDQVYNCQSEWKLLPSFDHPDNAYACLVSGTGLTHKNSALNRQVMHQAGQDKLTDSMKMYQWGLEGGQVKNGSVGVQPEWFYKGAGNVLKAHNETLDIPAYANDGGEEPEVAGVYIVDANGQPYRIGFTTGNEFSDHIMERKNYLYLAPSKLRNCAIGPELLVGDDFHEIEGTVSVIRNDQPIWSQDIKTGENNMAHSLANLEYHHFKYTSHRLPLQAHVHFFGADAFSFGHGVQLENGDLMSIQWKGFGRPLKNKVAMHSKEEKWIGVKTML